MFCHVQALKAIQCIFRVANKKGKFRDRKLKLTSKHLHAADRDKDIERQFNLRQKLLLTVDDSIGSEQTNERKKTMLT